MRQRIFVVGLFLTGVALVTIGATSLQATTIETTEVASAEVTPQPKPNLYAAAEQEQREEQVLREQETIKYLQAVDADNKRRAAEAQAAEAAAAKAARDRKVAAAAAAARADRGAPRSTVGGDILDALARCESGMRNLNTGNGYLGYFQFLQGTWNGLGYSGPVTAASYETQKEAAGKLIARSGWGQFPGCARKLGMR